MIDIGLRNGITRKSKVRISSVCDPRWVQEDVSWTSLG